MKFIVIVLIALNNPVTPSRDLKACFHFLSCNYVKVMLRHVKVRIDKGRENAVF